MIPVRWLGLALAGLVWALPLCAAESVDPLKLVPPNAIAVVQVNGVERVQERVDKLLKAAVPDKADQASKAVHDAVAEALQGRDLKALSPDGRLLVAISELEKLPDDATLTMLFPVKNADDFKKGFLTDDERKSLAKDGDLETVKLEDRAEPFFLVPLSGYVAACTDKETAAKYAKGEISGIANQLSRETAAAFLDADLSLFVNVREVNARYGTQLKTYKSLADLFLKGDAVQGVNKAQMDQLKAVLDAAFQVLEDGTAAVLTVQFRPDGWTLKGLAQFGDKTGTSEALKKYRPVPLNQLGTLPAGQVSYSASVVGQAGSKSAALLLGDFAISDDDPAAKETIAGLLRDLSGLDRGVTLAAGKVFGPGGLDVTESKDADRIVAGRLELLRAVTKNGSFANIPLKEKPQVKEKAETVGAFTLHAVKVKLDFDKAVGDLDDGAREAARNSMKKALGGDELSMWFGTDGKRLIQLTAKDWAEAKALAEPYLDGSQALDKNEAYQFTRKQLPADATMLVVLDAAQTVYSLFGLAGDAGGLIPGLSVPLPENAKPPTGKPAYIGIALVLKPGHGSFELFVPATAVGQIQKLVQPLLDKNE
jgi:hypothetical protein